VLTEALSRLEACGAGCRDRGAEVADRAARVAILLAIDAATRGDRDAARGWGLRALAVSEVPELAADRLLRHPATAALAGDPAWARVRALGRTLATPP
jgi:hypothetical protein